MKYADIIIDISHEKVDKTFQYRIPEGMRDKVAVGTQVCIPFGRGQKKRTGYVVGISDEPKIEEQKIKDICSVSKDALPIESQLIVLAAWMKQQYGSTMIQALKTVLPIKKKESVKEKRTVSLRLSEEEAKAEYAVLMTRKNHSVSKEMLLKALIKENTLSWDEITEKRQIPSQTIRDMEKRGWVNITSARYYRRPMETGEGEKKQVVLNKEQQQAVDEVLYFLKQGKAYTYLLHGVTGSGKTQVYMELIEHCLAQGKSAIVLIPEIALTYQTLMRFYGRFADKVSVIHSRMSPGERFDQFERAKAGEIQIMVGPRSALFTPFSNLGLIILDEEHETSYKSETIPKYHARETAIARAQMSGASVILGSATPSVESYYRAQCGEYKLLTLSRRVEDKPLPQCEIVDLREELKGGNRSILSRQLAKQIQERLNKKEQTILFLNRRGMLGFVSCRACGHVIKCPHCDVSLSLHQGNQMRCHYCGYQVQSPKICPKCGSKYIGGFRAGTQKIEEVVRQQFPQARVLRMDKDTTRGKNGHQAILETFSAGEADILIGTQMIVKGHDFPGVTLVGVLAADLSLNAGDFHSAERTFQLLTQAAGRAGRGETPGQVIFQTYQPKHYSVLAAKEQDYEMFYQQEIVYRQLMNYPPAAHLLLLQITSSVEEHAIALAQRLAEQLQKREPPLCCIGPSEPAIAKINDIYRRMIYIKSPKYQELVEIKDDIEKYIQQQNDIRDVSVWFDFDPMSGF